MSDTPRTDALESDFPIDSRLSDSLWLCRELEKELTARTQEVERLRERVKELEARYQIDHLV